MLGAIIGDIVGSRFEWNNYKAKDFDFLTYKCFPTDDSIMSLAVAKAILKSKPDHSDLPAMTVRYMQQLGNLYPDAGYGGMFRKWLKDRNPQPYKSYGNGAAMRVSAAGFAAKDLIDAKILSKMVTGVTHNHPEGIKGAEATAVAIFLARSGKNMLEIRDVIDKEYYPMNFTLDGIRDSYKFNETCQETVPQALMAFFESTSFEDAIRNAISIGGDSDTLAAITGGVAEAYYGIPVEIRKHALTFLDERQMEILVEFENKYPSRIEKVDDNVSVSVKAPTKVELGDRETMIQSAVESADKDLADSVVESEETTSQQLFNHLFEACNILRGPINQDDYKSYVTPLLFYKRLSDVYDEETQSALEESGGDIEYASFPENHRFVIPNGSHWRDLREVSVNVGTAIVNSMLNVEKANPDTLYGVFSSFDDANWTDKTKLSDERLKNLIEHMSKIKVGNTNYSSDIMGDSYEFLIKRFADMSKKNAGEFYTPRSVVKLMVRILAPKAGEEVYDPACGTGGMLIEAIRFMGNKKQTYGRIYGQEKNLSTSSIARMNLFLHGAQDFNVVQGDTLRSPLFMYRGELQKFDCVIANPPFSLKKWGAKAFESDIYGRNIYGTPSDSCADYAWIQHMVTSMKKATGRCAVVLPQGVLFRNKEHSMRQAMVEADKLETIITVGNNIFYGTPIPVCILIFRQQKTHPNKFLFINGSEIYTTQRAQNIISEKDADELFALYAAFSDKAEKSKVVSVDEIRNNNYNLAMVRYVATKEAENLSYKEAASELTAAMDHLLDQQKILRNKLREGGYINE
jgi:type I restriction enzyme M protein